MTEDTDEKFFNRADAHIKLANEHLSDAARGKVSASLMFAASRFNAWSSAADLQSKEEMLDKREEVIEYFMSQYRSMLEENINNYIEHFDTFMNGKANS
jgi:hypothetical protein